ncbi:unnamed protein product [Hapterophycus canaliculatus]
MLAGKKNYSYTNLAETPQHGEIIESSYLLPNEKGPKSTWTRVLEMVVLVATIGVCAYLFLFLFHHGNHRPVPAKSSPSQPTPPVGASSSVSRDASCASYTKCVDLGDLCCPTHDDVYLDCCYET